VPVSEASLEGADIRVPYEKDLIRGAPSIEADGELSQQEEAELYSYYGLDYSEYGSGTGLPAGKTDVRERAEDFDTSGPTADDAMTRSEEELAVGKDQREAGRARLRKYVTTENVTQTVPVQREEVRVERAPITDANVGQATSDPDISDGEHDLVLTEEEPVVEKRTVPKERVRMTRDTVAEEREVSEEVRKEQIDIEGGAKARR
jgi:uncharacterized protein (TIGR02271 family)